LFIDISLKKGAGFASALSCSVLRGFGDGALGAAFFRRFGRVRLLGLLFALVLLLIGLLLRAGLILLTGFVLLIVIHWMSLGAENPPASTTLVQVQRSSSGQAIYSKVALAYEGDREIGSALLSSTIRQWPQYMVRDGVACRLRSVGA
jgi:hypothetical protein